MKIRNLISRQLDRLRPREKALPTRLYWEDVDYDALSHRLATFPEVSKLTGWIEALAPGKVLADLGCGPGDFFSFFQKAQKVYAVDWSSSLLQRARSRNTGQVEFMERDIRDLRLPEKVDLALAFDCLYADSPADAMVMLTRCMETVKTGGHLLLVVPSLESEHLLQTAGFYEPENPVSRQQALQTLVDMRAISPLGWMMVSPTLVHKFWTREEMEFLLNRFFDIEIVTVERIHFPPERVSDDFILPKKARPLPWYWAFKIRNNQEFNTE